MLPEQTLTIRARGGGGQSALLAVWAPILAKVAAALVAAAVLATIGIRAGNLTWNSAGSPARPAASSAAAFPASGLAPAHGPPPPSAFDAGAAAEGSAPANHGGAPPGALRDGRIVLNGASEEQLVRLPGIGPARAQAILALRERLGRFHSVDQLRRVKGIGRKTLQKIAPNVVVDAPRPADIEKDAG